LFLYSFVLCHLNGIDIAGNYWTKLRAMLAYMAAYLRPDGRAPLLGDSDSGQVMPIVKRAGDDHGYLLALGAAIFQEQRFGLPSAQVPEELLWILGEQGLRDYESLPDVPMPPSQAFADAGIYVLRNDDLYLLFNASDSGVNGRGSHGHNDALSIEVSACGVPFILDPGTYLYTANLSERHLFRSTTYHSTVQVDHAEQNTIEEQVPFIIGNEAQPRVLKWESNAEADVVVAEHYGYQRLAQPVTHRRTVQFDKRNRYWRVEDEMSGTGAHQLSFRIHFAPGLETTVRADGNIEAYDKISGARLLILPSGLAVKPELEARFSSRDYGSKDVSVSACWTIEASVPMHLTWFIVPIWKSDDEQTRLAIVRGQLSS